jgi:hypothetical protein
MRWINKESTTLNLRQRCNCFVETDNYLSPAMPIELHK